MKNLLSLIVIGGTLTFAACTKPNTEPSTQQNENGNFQTMNASLPNIQVSQNGYLVFKDVDEYETALHILSKMTDQELDSWENSLGYVSAYTKYGFDIEDPSQIPAKDKNSKAFDPLFKRIINEDGIIQIGAYIFNSILDDGYMLEMDAANVSWAWNAFKRGDYSSEYMNKFSSNEADYLGTHNDVFELLETGVHGINVQTIASMGLFGKSHEITNTTDETGAADFRVRAENAYQSSVIYFSLITKAKVQWKHPFPNSLFGWEIYPTGQIWYDNASTNIIKYRRRGNGTSEIIKTGQYPTSVVASGERKWRAYEGGRGLRYYNFVTTTVTYNGLVNAQNISTTTQVHD